MTQLCLFLGVDPDNVTWDAATETVEGDVSAVIGNILRAKFGEDWSPKTPPPDDDMRKFIAAFPLEASNQLKRDEDVIYAFNEWRLTVGDVRRCRAAVNKTP